MKDPQHRRKAGHYEILGETLAKFEFFEAGWNPYQRYLDVDKVDFILRRRHLDLVDYCEVQVKYGKLYDCTLKWERPLFDLSSWRFFTDGEFSDVAHRRDFYLTYVLAHDSGYAGDLFIFPISVFHNLLNRAVVSGEKRIVWISRSKLNKDRWYFRIARNFASIDQSTCIDVTEYRRNFAVLGPESRRD